MKSYVLSWAGSGATSEILADTDEQAIEQARSILGGQTDPDSREEIVSAEQWDQDGLNGDDAQCKRILFWADEKSAENDPGANAIAELSTVGNPS